MRTAAVGFPVCLKRNVVFVEKKRTIKSMGDIIMKRCYVGVGGIGCRLLKEYEKIQNQDRYIYIDADLHCLG